MRRVTLDEKRKIIEVLLCAANDFNVISVCGAATCCGYDYWKVQPIIHDSYRSIVPGIRYSDRLAIVAYRLIESSPTLRREWI